MADEQKDGKKGSPAQEALPQGDGIISYADSSRIHGVENRDYNDYSALTEKRDKLPNFEERFLDFVDYIVTITHNIWEEKGIGTIYDTYHNNVVMHTGNLNLNGIAGVIAGTLGTLHGFPDRKLIAQNVIWSKIPQESYLSSHRILSVATNANQSEFGPPTGRRVSFRTTVDCVAKDNRIYEEWLVRDNLWIVKQLGLDVQKVAFQKAQDTLLKSGDLVQYGYPEEGTGQLFPKRYTRRDESVGEVVREMVNRLYTCKDFNSVGAYYHEYATVNYICDKTLVSHNQIQGMLVSLFSALPSSHFHGEKITCNRREDGSWDVAVRWYLRGQHTGIGLFGKPSGKFIEILGINHLYMKEGLVLKEWVTFDVLDIYRQIWVQKILAGETEDFKGEDNA